MSYKVIVDSCGELTPEMKASGIFETASLTIEVGGHLAIRGRSSRMSQVFLSITGKIYGKV